MSGGFNFPIVACLLLCSVVYTESAISELESYEQLTLFQKVRAFAQAHPAQVDEVLVRMVNMIPDKEQAALHLKAVREALADTRSAAECTACKVLIRVFRLFFADKPWNDIKQQVHEWCVFLVFATDQTMKAWEICKVTDIQGPHVAKIIDDRSFLGGTSPDEICTFQNACYLDVNITALMQRESDSGTRLEVQSPNAHPETNGVDRMAEKLSYPDGGVKHAGQIKIAQITDVHIEPKYAKDSATDCGLIVCCQSIYTDPGPTAGVYGDYNCNVPVETLQLFLDDVKAETPHFVIFSGDAPPHAIWEETMESQVACTATLTNLLASVGVPAFTTTGNHEMYPTNLFSIEHLPNETTVMMEEFANLWQNLSNLNTAEFDNYKMGGYYTAIPLPAAYPKLRILSINTNYFYTNNWYNVWMHKKLISNEVLKMKTFAEDTLEAARANNETVILVGHHVPGGGDYLLSQSKWYAQLVADYSDILVLQVAGHTHTDEFRLIYDDASGELKSMLYVSPSLDMHGVKNPSVRIYYLNADTFQLEDYEQYYFDLKDVSGATQPTIKKLYSAKEAYNLPDLTPSSWLDMLTRFSTDQELLLRHRSHGNAKAYTSYSCDERCLHNHVCRLKYASLDTYTACVNLMPPPTTVTVPRPPTPTSAYTTPTSAPTLPVSSSVPIIPGICITVVTMILAVVKNL